MKLVEAIGLTKDWAGTPVFEGAAFSIEEGEKIGLVGRNGCGKSSLLGVLAGRDEDYRGTLRRKPGLRAALVPQAYEPPAGLACAALLAEPAARLALRLEALGEELGSLEGSALERALAEYGELRGRYELLGAEGAEEKAERLLERLGLPGSAGREAARLSGGEKNVLALALALMGEPELLLLDEPGNHLDFAGLSWLEEFVRGERRAVLMVSHNRWLLDRSVDSILELEERRVSRYSGGFSAFRLEKLKRAAGQGKEWQADRKRVERLEALVRRFAEIAAARPDPAWGKRLRARRSQLEREKAQAAERPELGGAKMSLSFAGAESKADFALVVRGYSKAFGSRVLFDGAGLDLLVGERAALVGPNGSGKTSFVRDLVAAAGSLDGGPIRVGPSMVLGYCAQERELFRAERTVAEEFGALGARDAETAKLLRRFLFGREVLEKRIASLSGGELNRLQIARAVYLGANFLVLDEPTNHLDIEGREAVEEGLADFEGTVLVVSHDRWFLEKVAERIILVEDGKLLPYEGSFAEYWRDRGASAAPRSSRPAVSRALEDRGAELSRAREARGRAAGGAASGAASRTPSGAPPGAAKGETARAAKGAASAAASRAAALEARIGELEKEKLRAEGESARAIGRRDFERGGRLAEEAAKLGRLLDKLYAEWEALA